MFLIAYIDNDKIEYITVETAEDAFLETIRLKDEGMTGIEVFQKVTLKVSVA